MLKATARLVSPAWIAGAFGFLSLLPVAAPATAGQGAANPSGITGQVASYLRPGTILFPRILQIGATFNF